MKCALWGGQRQHCNHGTDNVELMHSLSGFANSGRITNCFHYFSLFYVVPMATKLLAAILMWLLCAWATQIMQCISAISKSHKTTVSNRSISTQSKIQARPTYGCIMRNGKLCTECSQFPSMWLFLMLCVTHI